MSKWPSSVKANSCPGPRSLQVVNPKQILYVLIISCRLRHRRLPAMRNSRKERKECCRLFDASNGVSASLFYIADDAPERWVYPANNWQEEMKRMNSIAWYGSHPVTRTRLASTSGIIIIVCLIQQERKQRCAEYRVEPRMGHKCRCTRRLSTILVKRPNTGRILWLTRLWLRLRLQLHWSHSIHVGLFLENLAYSSLFTFFLYLEMSHHFCSCQPGLALLGDSIRTCQNDGLWSGSRPRCGESPFSSRFRIS